jgi:hypothetical protein
MRWPVRVRVVVVVAAVAVLGPASLAAQDFSVGGLFLPLGHGARAQGLGGMGVALVRDDAAVYWNPANLCWLEPTTGVTLAHADLFPEVGDGQESVSWARAAGRSLAVPGQALPCTRWGYGLLVRHVGFGFDTSAWSENTLQLSGAAALGNVASLGLSMRLMQLGTDFESGDAWGGGLDVGTSILVTDRLSLAVVLRDLWTRVHFDTGAWQTQKAALESGLEWRPWKSWSACVEGTLREGTLRRAGLGLEWRARREIALRGGWTQLAAGETRGFPSAGVGLRWSRFGLDYGASFDEADALGTRQRVSLQVDL